MTALYIGLDVHEKTSTYCVLDQHGKHLRTITIRGRWLKVVQSLKQWAQQGPITVAYEASLGYGTLYDQLTAFCERVVVAHPGQLRLIFRAKRKNDRIDAQKIATLLFMDQLPAVHVPSLDVRGWRELVAFRTSMIHKRTACKNSLRSLLRGHRIVKPIRQGLWTKAGLAWLDEAEMPTPQAAIRRDVLLADLRHLERQVKRVTQELDRVAQQHPGVQLLQTIPGVGPRTAEAFVAYVDDPHRFAKVSRIGAYVGLVPCQDSSASVNRLGHITKEGPATLRQLLVEAAWRAIAREGPLRQRFDQITADKKERRRIAIIAVAHKLARIMLAMLQSGCTYTPPVPQQPQLSDRAA